MRLFVRHFIPFLVLLIPIIQWTSGSSEPEDEEEKRSVASVPTSSSSCGLPCGKLHSIYLSSLLGVGNWTDDNEEKESEGEGEEKVREEEAAQSLCLAESCPAGEEARASSSRKPSVPSPDSFFLRAQSLDLPFSLSSSHPSSLSTSQSRRLAADFTASLGAEGAPATIDKYPSDPALALSLFRKIGERGLMAAYKIYSLSSAERCALHCVKDPLCLSFDFQRATAVCYISHEDR